MPLFLRSLEIGQLITFRNTSAGLPYQSSQAVLLYEQTVLKVWDVKTN